MRGLIEELVDAQIDGAGNGAELGQQVGGERVIGVQIRAGHLNVDGRGQAEVQNLADDVGRQEIERHARKLARQALGAARERSRRWADGRA